MRELVFLLEELSARKMLEAVLPKIVDTEAISIRYIVFDGKSDLESKMVGKLRGYLNTEARFLVIRDQDAAPDCRTVKQSLLEKCVTAGVRERCLVRIACRELESFYLADLSAVEAGLQITGIAKQQNKTTYRSPDTGCDSPSGTLDKITKGGYQKVAGSQAIAPYLDVANDRSTSFKNLIDGIKRLAAT